MLLVNGKKTKENDLYLCLFFFFGGTVKENKTIRVTANLHLLSLALLRIENKQAFTQSEFNISFINS